MHFAIQPRDSKLPYLCTRSLTFDPREAQSKSIK